MTTQNSGTTAAPASRRNTAVLVTLCVAALLISLDTTIVNVTLPTLVRDLHASNRQLQWIVDSYNLVFAARSERAKAIGLWGAMTGVGVALGPICGGWLLEQFWWGSVFAALVPVAAVVAVMTVRWVPTSRDPSTPPLDLLGLGMSTAM